MSEGALAFTPVEAPRDETPTPFDPEFPDSTPEAPYGYLSNGEPRKRRPKGTGRTASTSGVPKVRSTTHDRDAQKAAELLAQANAIVIMGATLGGFSETASALSDRNESFQEQVYQACLMDPALTKQILKAGQTSGKALLALAYASMLFSVAPVAIMELRERRALRAFAEGAEDAETV